MSDYDLYHEQEALDYADHCIKNLIAATYADIDRGSITIEGPHMAVWGNPIKISRAIV